MCYLINVYVYVYQSVFEENFRYTGARICAYFCGQNANGFVVDDFRKHLLKR